MSALKGTLGVWLQGMTDVFMCKLARTIFAFFLAIIPTNALADITVEQIRDARRIAEVLRLEEPCGYRISDHALQSYYKANGLFTPEALALVIREMKKPVGSPSQYECTLATANALRANLLVEKKAAPAVRIETVTIPGATDDPTDTNIPFDEQVNSCWEPPDGMEALSASMRATLNQHGHVNGIETINGSGNEAFDESARQTILRCGPYNPPKLGMWEITSVTVTLDGSR